MRIPTSPNLTKIGWKLCDLERKTEPHKVEFYLPSITVSTGIQLSTWNHLHHVGSLSEHCMKPFLSSNYISCLFEFTIFGLQFSEEMRFTNFYFDGFRASENARSVQILNMEVLRICLIPTYPIPARFYSNIFWVHNYGRIGAHWAVVLREEGDQ